MINAGNTDGDRSMSFQKKEIDMFWYGFIVGIFIGANLGILVTGLLIASRNPRRNI